MPSAIRLVRVAEVVGRSVGPRLSPGLTERPKERTKWIREQKGVALEGRPFFEACRTKRPE